MSNHNNHCLYSGSSPGKGGEITFDKKNMYQRDSFKAMLLMKSKFNVGKLRSSAERLLSKGYTYTNKSVSHASFCMYPIDLATE